MIVLIGGEVANPEEWPNSLWIGNCTGTVVGERVLVTAAHCVRNGGNIGFTKGSSRYAATCTHHPEYRGNSTADWALCKISTTVLGGEFEKLNTNPELVKLGTKPTLQGYGCIKWGNGIDGKLRIGQAPIVELPNENQRDYDVTTRGKVALCSGDSGGASFVPAVAGENIQGDRFVMSVNSRSNTTTTSYMPAWHMATAQKWGKAWAEKNGVKICGYNPDATGCRKAIPPIPNAFKLENSILTVNGVMKPGKEGMLEKAATSVLSAIKSLEN